MPEALYSQVGETVDYTPTVSVSAGQVVQMPDGRAAFCSSAISAGNLGAATVRGIVRMAKTTSMVFLAGGRVYWDYSANKLHYKKVNDIDFYVGRVTSGLTTTDAASADTECYVAINVDPPYDVDLLGGEGGFLSVPTGTQAVGAFGFPKPFGKSIMLELTATSEAQCIDALSVNKFAIASNAICEFQFRPAVNGSGAAVDFSIGVANGTSTTDADAITEHCLIHIDGGSTAILAQSKDGTTTVTATDTTATISAGAAVANRKEVWMDLRDPADVQIYIDGALVLGSTVFALGAGTGPLGLLAHIEKTTGTTTGQFYIDAARARFMET